MRRRDTRSKTDLTNNSREDGKTKSIENQYHLFSALSPLPAGRAGSRQKKAFEISYNF
jgi:hypothetical protein